MTRQVITIREPALHVETTDEVVNISLSTNVITVRESVSGPQGAPGRDYGFDITISDTPPINPSINDLWIDTSA